jgi:tripartite-type tricarboxylate transporter receptor subunit TctC
MANQTVVLAAACVGLQLGISQVVFAQGAYPSRPITIINPFPPEGRRKSSRVRSLQS